MSYCTQAEVQTDIGEARLLELTDDAQSGSIDWTVVDEAIEGASKEIDAYCSIYYTVPFSPIPQLINNFAIAITKYRLYSRRGVPDQLQWRYEEILRTLVKIAQGKMKLGTTEDPPTQSGIEIAKASKTSEDRTFTDFILNEYTL